MHDQPSDNLKGMLDDLLLSTQLSKGKILELSFSLCAASFGKMTSSVQAPASRYDTLDAATLLRSAHTLSTSDGCERKVFTMDDLLSTAFASTPLIAEHDVKVWAGRLLKAAGYERRQIRLRGGDRPLVWEKTSTP